MTFLLDNVGKLTAVHAVDREIIQKLLKRLDSIKFTSCFANQHTTKGVFNRADPASVFTFSPLPLTLNILQQNW